MQQYTPAFQPVFVQYIVDSIPIIFHPVWQYNHGHTLMSTMSWVYNNLNQSANAELARRARCVTTAGLHAGLGAAHI